MTYIFIFYSICSMFAFVCLKHDFLHSRRYDPTSQQFYVCSFVFIMNYFALFSSFSLNCVIKKVGKEQNDAEQIRKIDIPS